ncbi:hypothetical protein BS78_08G122100, partial [Paspalum vaginatum]
MVGVSAEPGSLDASNEAANDVVSPSSPPPATPATASTLNANATPFFGSAAGPSERVRLSVSPFSLSDEDLSDDGCISPSFLEAAHCKGKQVAAQSLSPPPAAQPSRPVPPELEGRCFNCLSGDHVAAACRALSRCFRCNDEGHQAKECWRHRRRRHRISS